MLRKYNIILHRYKLIFYILMFLFAVAILLARNFQPLTYPVMYAEEGIWTSNILIHGVWYSSLHSRVDFPVLGIILLMYLGILINKIIWGFNLTYLPIIYAVISYAFYAVSSLFAYNILNKLSKPLAIMTFLTILLMPLGVDSNEVIGRIINIGFFTPVLTMMACMLRLKCRNIIFLLLIDLFNLISCLTFPVSFGIIFIYTIVDYFKVQSSHKISLFGLIMRYLSQFLSILISVLFLAGLEKSTGGTSGLSINHNGIISYIFGRLLVYPLFSSVWNYMNNWIVLIISFIIFLFLFYTVIISFKTKKFWFLIVIGSVVVYWASFIVKRLPLSTFFSSTYGNTYPDRYFYGLNIMFTIALFSGIFIITKKYRFVNISFFCIFLISILLTKNEFSLDNPPLVFNKFGTFKQSIIKSYRENRVTSSGNYIIPIYPTKNWIMILPSKYVLSTVENSTENAL